MRVSSILETIFRRLADGRGFIRTGVCAAKRKSGRRKRVEKLEVVE
jgi:hypothetical protein